MPSSAETPDTAPFEESLERLEALVGELESGELELEAALRAFEEGVRLSRRCNEQLSDAERRIEVLVAQSGGTVRETFDDAEEDI